MQLVTGGAGFVGSHLVSRLLRDGHRVRVLDNLSTGKMANLPPGIELVEGDVTDEAAVLRAVEGIEVVYHQAALPSVARSIMDPRPTLATNVGGTLNVLVAARDSGCRRVVYASSSSVYGDAPGLPRVETMSPAPLSPYAVSKLAGEHLCRAFSVSYGLETVALRYFNVFGERQDPESQYAAVIPSFLRALQGGRSPTVYGDGEQSRDFTHVDNVVEANLRAASTPLVAGRVFNVAAGRAVTVNQLLASISRILDRPVEPEHSSPRPGEVRHSRADITAARDGLGYDVVVPFEDGLRRTVLAYAEA